MSVLIKGMEMPIKCEDCPCFYPEYNECNAIVGRWVDGKGTPPSDCPLVPVPPHGRLIDADALITTFCEWGTRLERGRKLVITMSEAKQAIVDIIEDAPTIIPAEEGE